MSASLVLMEILDVTSEVTHDDRTYQIDSIVELHNLTGTPQLKIAKLTITSFDSIEGVLDLDFLAAQLLETCHVTYLEDLTR